MQKAIGLAAAMLLCAPGTGWAEPLEFFLPRGEAYVEDVPAPQAFFGFEPGQQHVAPEVLIGYFSAIAAASDRVAVAEIGRSHERRPLIQVYISSPENIANLDALRERHLRATSAQEDSVLFINLSYSIHGNEPSGANAAPLVAYYLAASQNAWVDALLQHTVVIIEPMQNPDGLARFSQWANSHQGITPNYDSQNRDRNSSWPSGRSNHYWFDLNRDWIFQVHPESRARVAAFQRWRPHVLGDYHEMGSDAPSYFFQPGHPRRVNPLTLAENQRITAALARFHASALDGAGQTYFTQERFDDFYYGKGSAYPDAVGGVGLLFEQTAVSGHHRDFDGIRLTFAQAIANQVTTSMSLLRGADALRGDLIGYRFRFEAAEARRPRSARASGYVFGDGGDPVRAAAFIDVLRANDIDVRALERPLRLGDEAFEPGHAWVALASGRQGRLTHSLFDTTTTFEDNIFYDISTWNLAMAFDLPFAAYVGNAAGLGAVAQDGRRHVAAPPEDAVAYAFSWNQGDAPRLLQALLDEELRPRVASLPFRGATAAGAQSFSAGTVTFTPRSEEERTRFLRSLGRAPGVVVVGLNTGLTPDGPDLGSREMKVVRPVRVALLVGAGADSSEAGEIWHLLDQRVGMPVTQIDLDSVGRMDLGRYTHILMPGGAFRSLRAHRDELRAWLQSGGVLVAQKEAAEWAYENIVEEEDESADDEGGEADADDEEDGLRPRFRAYQDYDHDRAEELIPGAIYRMDLDLTHPLAFGYERPYLDVMRTSEDALEPAEGRYDTPARYAREPLRAGYSSVSMLRDVAGKPAVTAHRVGEGFVIAFADNLNFRGIWRGGARMYLNAIFFAQAIEERDED